MGDANCSGAVDLADAHALRRSVAGILPNPSCIVLAADVTCDNNVDASDVLAILRSLAGLPNTLEPGCLAVGAEITNEPSSAQLIAQALAAGDIDASTALVYGVFAAYGDPRLPAELNGDDAKVPSSLDAALAYQAYSTLSPEQQAAIAPYMLPPSADGSWYAPIGNGNTTFGFNNLVSSLVNVAGTPGIRIWTAPGFPAQALADLSGALSQILTTTKTSMNRIPLDDSAMPNHGPDGALDVYIVPGLAVNAMAKWYEPNGCKNGPMYVELNENTLPAVIQPHAGGFAGIIQDIAHVFTQATAGGVSTPGASEPCVFGEAFRWAIEATGALTEHLAYPDVNSEHRWDEVFETPYISMHEFEEGGQSLWTLLEHLSEGSPGVVSSMWALAETQPSALAALAASADLDTGFAEFALELFNEGPNSHFSLIHNITTKVLGNTGMPGGGGIAPIAINLAGQSSVALSTGLSALDDFSAQHYRFTIADPEVKSVSMGNLIHNIAGTTFKAMTKDGSGPWQVLDLTAKALSNICLTEPGKHITDLMLVMTNGETDNHTPAPFADRPIVEARSSCGYAGSMTYLKHGVCTTVCNVSEFGQVTDITYTLSANDLVFTRSTTAVPNQEFYVLASGTVNVSVQGTDTDDLGMNCTLSGNDTVILPAGQAALRVQHNQDGTTSYAIYGYFAGAAAEFSYDRVCTGSGSRTENGVLGQWLCSGGAKNSLAAETLSGSYHFQASHPEALIDCPTTSEALPPPNAPVQIQEVTSSQTRDYSWTLTR